MALPRCSDIRGWLVAGAKGRVWKPREVRRRVLEVGVDRPELLGRKRRMCVSLGLGGALWMGAMCYYVQVGARAGGDARQVAWVQLTGTVFDERHEFRFIYEIGE